MPVSCRRWKSMPSRAPARPAGAELIQSCGVFPRGSVFSAMCQMTLPAGLPRLHVMSNPFGGTKVSRNRATPSRFSIQKLDGAFTMKMKHDWELPPVALTLPERPEDALEECARGQASPDVALLHLLALAKSQTQLEEALGSAIWDALESRDRPLAERLGAMQHLWDGDRQVVESAFR